MTRKELTINGTNYEFYLDSRDTRHGFKRVCELYINGFCKQVATAQYYNRTWERYRYQSVILSAITQEIELRKKFITLMFKSDNGYKKITAKRKNELQKEFDSDYTLKELNELYNLYK